MTARRVLAERAVGFATTAKRHQVDLGAHRRYVDCTDDPFPTITADRPVHIALVVDPHAGAPPVTTKPPYQVPYMTEIASRPPNGRTAVSLFAGAGGSSLGYRMAGFRVAWASEFVEAARDTYKANAAAGTLVDRRDIRDVTAADILADLQMGVGDLDVLDGSPPCAAFSTAGQRHESWGQTKRYSDTTQRTDDLFFEYARLVAGLRPRVFVAENVSGLVKGPAKGHFQEIMRALKGHGYRVAARVLDAQWLGVPQARQRLIFIGVREDLDRDPVYPTPLTYRYSVRDALPHLLTQGDNGGYGVGGMQPTDVHPSPTIGAKPWTGNGDYPPGYVQAAPRVLHETGGTTASFSAGDVTDRPCPTITTGAKIGCNSRQYRVVDQLDGPELDPETGHTLHIATRKDDPAARIPRRRLTLGELRRICGFPDDFVLTGTYPQRWERLGRAVPPPMMHAIARTVRDDILGDRP